MAVSSIRLNYRYNDVTCIVYLYDSLCDLNNGDRYLAVRAGGQTLYANLDEPSNVPASRLRAYVSGATRIVREFSAPEVNITSTPFVVPSNAFDISGTISLRGASGGGQGGGGGGGAAMATKGAFVNGKVAVQVFAHTFASGSGGNAGNPRPSAPSMGNYDASLYVFPGSSYTISAGSVGTGSAGGSGGGASNSHSFGPECGSTANFSGVASGGTGGTSPSGGNGGGATLFMCCTGNTCTTIITRSGGSGATRLNCERTEGATTGRVQIFTNRSEFACARGGAGGTGACSRGGSGQHITVEVSLFLPPSGSIGLSGGSGGSLSGGGTGGTGGRVCGCCLDQFPPLCQIPFSGNTGGTGPNGSTAGAGSVNITYSIPNI